jgi:hypothetical protein
MYRRISFVVIIVIMLSGCNSSIGPLMATQTGLVKQNVPISTPTGFVAESTPALAATPTPSPTPSRLNTVTDSAFPAFTKRCLDSRGEVALKDVATGTIILDTSSAGEAPLTLLELQSGKTYPLPIPIVHKNYHDVQTSPDRNMFAYLDDIPDASGGGDKSTLWIVNATGEVLQKAPFNMDVSGTHWLDNEHLTFTYQETGKTGDLIFFDSLTLAQHFITNKMPGLYSFGDSGWLVTYSPDLQWGVYFGSASEAGLETNSANKSEGGLAYIVRNFTAGKAVWHLSDSGEAPIWSPDGQQVALVSRKNHLYLVDRAGKSKPVFNESIVLGISKPAWSPDGRYIAFWNFKNLILLDLQQDQVFDLCMVNPAEVLQLLVWSADSKQIAIPMYSTGGFLIDLLQWVEYQIPAIPDTQYPVGWMNSMP